MPKRNWTRVTRNLLITAVGLMCASTAFGTITTYTSTPVGVVIPEALPPGPGTPQSVTDTIFVPDMGSINDINVTVTLFHPEIVDLSLRLTDPTGTVTVSLIDTEVGPGDGFDHVTWDDEAAGGPPGFVTNGVCLGPTSYTVTPGNFLSDFDGLEVNGIWTLEVTDNFVGDAVDCDCDAFVVGPACPKTLDEWSMEIDFSAGADADLAITKTDGLDQVNQGETLTYTIEVNNNGPDDVIGATVTDAFPADLSCTWTCIASAGGSCTAGPVTGDIADVVDLPAGGIATYSAVCDVAGTASGTLSNTATVAAPGGVTDPDPGNDEATDTTAVNQAPVAQCTDVGVEASEVDCLADADIDDGSFDPDGDPIVLAQSPPGPYGLGDTAVTLTVTDDGGLFDECSATVTVTDVSAPVAFCNAPPTITPPDAPISFTATAVDPCGPTTVEVVEFDCYKKTKQGKRIDKTESCIVTFDGATLTVHDSGGVGNHITWKVGAVDGSGNSIVLNCEVEVVKPGN